MKSSIKTLNDQAGLHDLRTYTGAVRKSAKPDLPTTAILDLYMRRNEHSRISGELKKLQRRKRQLETRLQNVEKDMNRLVVTATKKAMELGRGFSSKSDVNIEPKEKSVLSY